MGYYLAFGATLGCVFILGWWANDWWRERQQEEAKEKNDDEGLGD